MWRRPLELTTMRKPYELTNILGASPLAFWGEACAVTKLAGPALPGCESGGWPTI